ncbi:MAG: hypothetical protein Q8L87_11710, partial [Anaerolineales bacterium]|nr:hypothetical protein [Anaerolineales bacterium]
SLFVFRFLLIVISLQFPALLLQEFFSLIFSRLLTLYEILLLDAKQVQFHEFCLQVFGMRTEVRIPNFIR